MIGYYIKRSSRKTIAIEITKDCQVLVRAPQRMPEAMITAFVNEKADWIRTHLAEMEEKKKLREETGEKVRKYTREELMAMGDRAKKELLPRLKDYAVKIGVTYGRVTFRNQTSRWGSCTAAGNINLNVLLMDCPAECQNYVLVHELCHRKEMNHSPAFWSEVERIMPDYRVWRQWLKDHGDQIMMRNPAR